MPAPVIYLTFSNNRDAYLQNLRRERKCLEKALRELEEEHRIKLLVDEGASLNDLFEAFRHYADQIHVFHFAGHAGAAQIQLELPDGSAKGAHAPGLAQILGRQANLKLVFLNGCSTRDQVDILLEEGVPAVLATSSPIDDDKATEFSEMFYLSLAAGESLQEAFETAQSYLASKHDEPPSIGFYRSGESNDIQSDSWGLYLRDEEAEVLHWKIPQRADTPLIRNRIDFETRPDVNDILIDLICEDLARFNPDLDYELNKIELDIPSIKREIADSFPIPIGEQLRKLMTRSNDPDRPDEMEYPSAARLAQLAEAYRTTVQFIYFTFLSQLWDEIHQASSRKLPATLKAEVERFFNLKEPSLAEFDYYHAAADIQAYFKGEGIPCFIEEFNSWSLLDDQQEEPFAAYQYLRDLYLQMQHGTDQVHDIESSCLQAELQLGKFLQAFAFLVKYKLAAIQNIEIIKERHEKPRFRHSQITLNKALTVFTTGADPVGVVFKNFTDNKCVLFLKTRQNEVLEYLSLSPFIIDKNVLTNDRNSQLYLYACQVDGKYVYRFLNDPRTTFQLVEQEYRELAHQFKKFKADMLGKVFPGQEGSKRPKTGSRYSRKRKSE